MATLQPWQEEEEMGEVLMCSWRPLWCLADASLSPL